MPPAPPSAYTPAAAATWAGPCADVVHVSLFSAFRAFRSLSVTMRIGSIAEPHYSSPRRACDQYCVTHTHTHTQAGCHIEHRISRHGAAAPVQFEERHRDRLSRKLSKVRPRPRHPPRAREPAARSLRPFQMIYSLTLTLGGAGGLGYRCHAPGVGKAYPDRLEGSRAERAAAEDRRSGPSG